MITSPHDAVSKAVRTGELVRKPCEHCGSAEKTVAHHPNYSKPLDVVWLCSSCHRLEHSRMARAKETAGDSDRLNLKVSVPVYRALQSIAAKHDRSISYIAKQFIFEGVKKSGVKL